MAPGAAVAQNSSQDSGWQDYQPPAQQSADSGWQDYAPPQGQAQPAPSPSWLDTAERYASNVGSFMRSLLPRGEEPPPPPAHTLEEWQNLPDAEKHAYHAKMMQWEQGQIKGAGNLAAGFMTPGATGLQDVAGQAPGLLEGWLKNTARKLYQSALKPSTTIPAARVTGAIDTALENRIPVSAKGLEKLEPLFDDLQDKVSQQIQSTGPNRVINPGQAVKNLADVRTRFATQVNPKADLAAIDAAGNEFLDQFRNAPGQAVRNMPASEAQAMKVGTYQQLRGQYGKLSSATIEAQKALARGLKEQLEAQFPELQALNQKESQFFSLEPLLERAVKRIGNHQIMGIGTPITAGAAKAMTGSNKAAAIAALTKAVFDDPAVKSRIAIMLDRGAAKQGLIGLAGKARLAGWLNALGRAAVQQASPDLSGQATAAAAQ